MAITLDGSTGISVSGNNSLSIGTFTAGNTTITGTANISSTLGVAGALSTGNTTVTGTLAANATNITGNTVITGTLVSNATTITGNVTITGTSFTNGVVTFANSTTNTVFITANGKVGIGTSDPVRHLTVTSTTSPEIVLQESSRGTDVKNWRLYNANNNLIFGRLNDAGNAGVGNEIAFTANGFVGIGTTSPDQLLKIHGSSNPALVIKETGNNVSTLLYSTASQGFTGTQSAHDFNIKTSDTTRITIASSNGNIGISNSSPSYRLHVTGGNVRAPEGILSPVFYINRAYGTSANTSGSYAYDDITTDGGIVNLKDHPQSGLNSFAHGTLAPWTQPDESMTWSYFRILFRATRYSNSYDTTAVTFKTVGYYYSGGWYEYGSSVSFNGTDGDRGARWVCLPWLDTSFNGHGLDVPGIGIKVTALNGVPGIRIGAAYIQYRS